MQENNFETVINTWRRLSGEQIESSALVSMSGDSDYQTHKKKEEETNLIIPERSKTSLATVASGSAVAALEAPPDNVVTANAEEKQELMRNDSEESKEGAGDSNAKSDSDKDYLENKDTPTKSSENKSEKDKICDKVDSVYLRPPPPHKTQSNTTNEDEDGCGIKCLYYTLQCCDCVLQ